MLAASLAGAMRKLLPGVEFEGIGGERMAAAGFRLTVRTTGWSSMGHVEALGRILPLLGEGLRHAAWLRQERADSLVLVDFGGVQSAVCPNVAGAGIPQTDSLLLSAGGVAR